MNKFLTLAIFVLFLTSCKNELTFKEEHFEKKSSLPCEENCPEVTLTVPVAENVPIVADSINKKVFSVVREIIYFGEKPYPSSDYQGLLNSFIASYDEMKTKNPKEIFGWEGKIEGKVVYESDSILNIKIKHYTFTGGAHGYSGIRSLLFDPKTGKNIPNEFLFRDLNQFKAFAEGKFRTKYKIPAEENINATGLMFENDVFELPLSIFFTDKGLLLYYNTYEAASYADGPKELVLTYAELKPYLLVK
ncbi:DUF3298 and DUF4163 domain-containing protein [Flavobacterium soli]|uniref:DUF3298 and DUF4163 domain-containing protein n=1 Tax=Flavobacterium soli TaxID=344881 RepID=UPI0004141710|nr:DUF3298 and DUF4163 domain-containing protein [Flavobacterium soli]